MRPQSRSRLASFLFYVPFGFRMWKLFKGTGAALADLRREYQLSGLTEDDLASDPLKQLGKWLNEAVAAQVVEPTAMALATSGSDGRPAARTVLLKGFDERGLVFYTNYGSRKGRHLSENPHASLLLAWLPLERQVEVRGRVEKVSEQETSDYFYSRPIGSQIGAWASHQSTALANRAELESEVERLMAEYRGKTVPVPPFWGGFRVIPESFEFWQGRPSRLHDRFQYSQTDSGWKIGRLSP